jgi:chromosome segregation ATPase
MKNLIGVVVLAGVCVGLAVVLLTTKKQAAEEKRKDTETIYDLSNKVVKATDDLNEQRQVNILLTNDLVARATEMTALTNKILEVASSLVKTEESLKAEQAELARRDARIAELEATNQQLDQKAIGLSLAITNLNTQIADTQRRLTASEGDKAFLEKELKRLMAEKSELERQFNDLTVLRSQVAKLKEELSIGRRLDWLRRGLFASSEQKGAQHLIQGGPAAAGTGQGKPNLYDLNVEVDADGSVRVIPPLTGTNAPTATNAPPQP